MTLDEIENRTRELGISHWDAISDLIADERRLSPRAIAALANFQRIVNQLAVKVEEVLSTHPGEGGSDEEPESQIESASPVSDLVKAAILDTGYENALK